MCYYEILFWPPVFVSLFVSRITGKRLQLSSWNFHETVFVTLFISKIAGKRLQPSSWNFQKRSTMIGECVLGDPGFFANLHCRRMRSSFVPGPPVLNSCRVRANSLSHSVKVKVIFRKVQGHTVVRFYLWWLHFLVFIWKKIIVSVSGISNA